MGVHGAVVVSLGLPVTRADSLCESCEVRLMVQSGEGKGRGAGGLAWKPGALAGLPLHSEGPAGADSSVGSDGNG